MRHKDNALRAHARERRENLPEEYREATAPLWQKYDLFRHKGFQAQLGGGKDDLSILLTYVAHDCYLSDEGRLGFVITQSLFKTSGGGEGFRSFEYQTDARKRFLTPHSVHDLSDFQSFQGATNRTAVMVVGKSKQPFAFPVPYVIWKKLPRKSISQDRSLEEVRTMTTRQALAAAPINSANLISPWLTVSESALPGTRKVIGPSYYKGHEGVNTGGLNGCFWIRILERLGNGDVLIENSHDVGQIKVERVQAAIDPDLVYPLLRGKDVWRWSTNPSAQIILANQTDRLAGIPEAEMKQKYPKTYAYLKKFEGNKDQPKRGTPRGRALYKKFYKPGAPFYSMFNVGSYTVSPWKVMWPEVGHTVRASVCGPEWGEFEKAPLPAQTVVAVSCETAQEAHFICALLNSAPAQSLIRGYIVLHPSPHVLDNLAIPEYHAENETHLLLAEKSEQCHTAAMEENAQQLAALEAQIDQAAASIWNITSEELRAVRSAL